MTVYFFLLYIVYVSNPIVSGLRFLFLLSALKTVYSFSPKRLYVMLNTASLDHPASEKHYNWQLKLKYWICYKTNSSLLSIFLIHYALPKTFYICPFYMYCLVFFQHFCLLFEDFVHGTLVVYTTICSSLVCPTFCTCPACVLNIYFCKVIKLNLYCTYIHRYVASH